MDIVQAIVDRPNIIARSDVAQLFSELRSAESSQSMMPVMETQELPKKQVDTATIEEEVPTAAQAPLADGDGGGRGGPALRETPRGKLIIQD